MLHWLLYLLLLIGGALSLLTAILSLPGLWLMAGLLGAFGWATGWDVYVGWPSVGTLLGLALLAEIVEFASGAAGSGAAGGGKRAAIGGIAGAFVGGLIGTPFFPVVGTIVGACAGSFVGAALLELTNGDLARAWRVGIGAAKGRLYGSVGKLIIGILMLLILLVAAIPVTGF